MSRISETETQKIEVVPYSDCHNEGDSRNQINDGTGG